MASCEATAGDGAPSVATGSVAQRDADASSKADVEPPQLWGTHAQLDEARWGHMLGLGHLSAVHLYPEVVSLAGAELAVMHRADAA